MKKHKQPYITILDENGCTNMCGIIHQWHDERNITVEWLSIFDIDIMIMLGNAPDLDSPIIAEMCEDVDLSKADYKLHFTWLTVAGDFIKDSKKIRKGDPNENYDSRPHNDCRAAALRVGGASTIQ